MTKESLLFSPLELRGVTLPNRIAVSPLCMYSATDGLAGDWLFAHLSTFARGKAGLVFTEATAVEPRGRITPACLGIWTDEQAKAIRPTVRFIEEMGCVPGMQIAHAGRKGSAEPPFRGGTPLAPDNADAWETVGPSAEPVGDGWPAPHALETGEIAQIVEDFAAAARRAAEIGFKVIEVHGAHGYLIQSFLSPLGNKRNDAYGGDIQGRMRFALEVAEAVRAAWPDDLPLFYRISAIDGPAEGWSLDDSVVLARELAARGVDVVDCSAGGIRGAPAFRANDAGKPLNKSGERPWGFQVPYADRVRQEADVKTMAVGVIVDPHQAEAILQEGRADLVALGREIMYNPFWPLHAAQALDVDPDSAMWPDQYGWAVQRRREIMAQNASALGGPKQ
ncbi:MAG: NADH:flavin oxidoreductase/NADH oxidase [Rhodospirillaceae bacterium]|nr:NADH:flavin oxidoreductase/NADH oxidase [Rhodospirillaceae bacterium]MDD9918693.1 NADH:flavin oxidoreductase/NADH oxidase [Rhodospirillaceae bacterium]MDD9924196.1 NADH:flavin oxidoreductase/NADH oxidase [Rhodospirillaceae bacterium]